MRRRICARKSSPSVLHPRGTGRHSPIEAVLLTGGEMIQIAGLLTLRERQPYAVHATAETFAALANNPIFRALDPASYRAASSFRARTFSWPA